VKQGLSLRISQQLALTPQLQQSIRLLQLSTLELSQEIEQMLQDNPFLEQDEPQLAYEEELQIERSQRDEAKLHADEQESLIDATFFIANNVDFTSDNDQKDAKSESNSDSDQVSTGLLDGLDLNGEASRSEPNDWDGDGSQDIAANDLEWGVEASLRSASASAASSDPDYDLTESNSASLSLTQHLHRQALGLRLSPEDRAALGMLIESLNDDGYLQDDLESLALSLGASTVEDVEELIARFSLALKWLQQFEPTGVGARDLAECLSLQLRAMPDFSHDAIAQTAARIVAQALELLARRDVKRLSQLCAASAQEIKSAIALITRLEPKPGRRFYQAERNIIVPDVIVKPQRQRGQMIFVAQLNADVLPRLHVNDMYANVLKGAHKSEATVGLQTRLQEARWYIKNVQQRFDTILRVSQAIVDRQSSFFKHGAVAMRPLVMREIADEIGMHESTISRVTTAKYMSTPKGTYELKYFFGSGLGTDTGSSASSTAVRELIKQFIEAENKARPFSDNALADILKEQGIDCARRTVAKYREALRIPIASLRKTL